MKTNQPGIDLVKRFESLQLTAYICPAGIPTIGYGHTATVTIEDVKTGKTITEEEAEALLKQDLEGSERAVERYVSVPLTDNQFSALVSFTFNVGSGSLKNSTLRKKLNAGDYDSVPGELSRWVKAGGKTLQGLVRRREAEGRLFVQ